MSRADGERCSAFFSCTVVGPHHTHVNEIGAAWCCDGEPERIARPAAPAAEADLRDGLIAAMAGLPRAEWDGIREAERLRIVHGPAADRLLAGPLQRLVEQAADEMTEAGELRVRLRQVEHDLEHVVRERDEQAAEAARLRETVARVEALEVQWETRDVRLSRRFAANELRRALDGGDG